MIQKVEKKDFHKHTFLEPLLQIPDCPAQIYYEGDMPEKNKNTKVLCVIGTRNITNYGKEVTDFLISGLIGHDIIIVSGLALGIDSRAHTAAMSNHLLTVSFPGSGLDPSVLYPRTNLKLASNIVESGGCMMSEYEPDTKSQLYTFPARNRLMAAVSDLVLVIEAKEKSGTQITARLALEYNKDVAIVPGSIFSQYSSGTAQLYKSGAYPVTSADDILEILGIKTTSDFTQESMFEKESDIKNLSEHEQVLMRLLQAPLGKDELIESSGLLAHEAIIAITNLESKKYVVEIYGELQRLR